MLKIKKSNNSIVIEGINNNLYPNNGTVTFPLNSIAAVVDEGDIVTFKSASNGDVIFSGKVEDITINDMTVSKEDVLNKFNTISNAPSGGGGTGTGAVDSVNGQTGAVYLTANDVNAYSKKEIDDKNFLTTIPDEYITDTELNTAIQGVESKIPNVDNFATKDELNLKADKTSIADMATMSWVGEQNYATNTLVDSKLDKNTYNEDKKTFALKSEIPSIEGLATESAVNEALNLKADKTSIADMATMTWVNDKNYLTTIPDEYVTETELNSKNYASKDELNTKQDKLIGAQVEGQNLKTINGQNLLGTGNIEITAGGGGGGKVDSVNGQVGNVTITAKDLNVYTIEEIDNKNFLTTIPDEYTTDTELNDALAGKVNTSDIADMATMSWVNNEKFLKEVPSEYITETELNSKNYATVDQLPNIEGKLDVSVYNEDKATFALKSEIPTIDDNLNLVSTNAVQNKLVTAELNKKVESLELTQQEYDELPIKDPNIMYIITDAPEVATKDELANKQDKLIGTETEGQNLKTINGQTLLGTGNITITSGVESVNGQTGVVTITANDLNTYTKDEIESKNYATKSELPNLSEYSKTVKITQSEYDNLPTKDADTLYVITDASAIDISVKLDKSVYESEKVNFATKEELNGKADASAISDMATQAWVTEQINAAIANVNVKINEINAKIV